MFSFFAKISGKKTHWDSIVSLVFPLRIDSPHDMFITNTARFDLVVELTSMIDEIWLGRCPRST